MKNVEKSSSAGTKADSDSAVQDSSVSQPIAKHNVSSSHRHRWSKEIISDDGNYFVCQNCGVKKKNIYLGYGKNGHAALYFLPNGERTSYRPDCC